MRENNSHGKDREPREIGRRIATDGKGSNEAVGKVRVLH